MRVLQILVLLFALLSAIPVFSQNRTNNEVLLRGIVKYSEAYYSKGKSANPKMPSKDAVVVAINKKGENYLTRTDEKGFYELKMPAGEYQIMACVPMEFSLETSSQTSNVVLKKGKAKLNLILFSHGCG